MTKKAKVITGVVIIVAVAVAAYLWWRNRQAANASQSPTGAYGTNLNSVAPELVGGSAGPSVGPAVSLPVNITLTEQAPSSGREPGSMQNGTRSANPVMRQRNSTLQGLGNTDAEYAAGGVVNPLDSSTMADATGGMHDESDDRSGATFDVDTGTEAGG